jgi:two-component system, OmpR family, sensor histidine kinase KdpD
VARSLGSLVGALATTPARWKSRFDGNWFPLPPYVSAALLIFATVLGLKLFENFLDSSDLIVLFLIPVVFCAWKLGQGPALFASALSVFLSATFIFEPLYDPRVASRQHLTHLIVFLITAVLAGRIAHDARRATQSLAARHRETEVLYSFSRRLMNLSTPAAIYAAIREHLGVELGQPFVLIAPGIRAEVQGGSEQLERLPASVATATKRFLEDRTPPHGIHIVAHEDGTNWIIKPLNQTNFELGLIAVNMGSGSISDIDAHQHIEATLGDAVSRLQRLDVEQALDDARLREKSEELREALIGSVTHDLRTPIATIMGSASVLSNAPRITESEKLSSLTRLITVATGDLDQRISNLINATRISSDGVKARLAWVDPTDIISAALHESEGSLSNHKVTRVLPGEPPLVETDPVLMKEVLRQLLDNAAKYSPAGSEIAVRLSITPSRIIIGVDDQGTGMTQSEINHAFDRFYRGPSQIGRSAGTGIGLWICQAFARVCGAQIKIESSGAGTSASVILPLHAMTSKEEAEAADD